MQNSGIFRLYQYLFLFVYFKLSMYVCGGGVHKGTESEQVRREHWMPSLELELQETESRHVGGGTQL